MITSIADDYAFATPPFHWLITPFHAVMIAFAACRRRRLPLLANASAMLCAAPLSAAVATRHYGLFAPRDAASPRQPAAVPTMLTIFLSVRQLTLLPLFISAAAAAYACFSVHAAGVAVYYAADAVIVSPARHQRHAPFSDFRLSPPADDAGFQLIAAAADMMIFMAFR
jgi:hypothetical protein